MALGALLLALAAGAPLAQQMFNEIQCNGGSCEGTDERDLITGTDEQDQIFAKDGNDQVDARACDDEVRGGTGRDLLFADTRRDSDDELNDGRGRDFLVGFGGSDLSAAVAPTASTPATISRRIRVKTPCGAAMAMTSSSRKTGSRIPSTAARISTRSSSR